MWNNGFYRARRHSSYSMIPCQSTPTHTKTNLPSPMTYCKLSGFWKTSCRPCRLYPRVLWWCSSRRSVGILRPYRSPCRKRTHSHKRRPLGCLSFRNPWVYFCSDRRWWGCWSWRSSLARISRSSSGRLFPDRWQDQTRRQRSWSLGNTMSRMLFVNVCWITSTNDAVCQIK